MVVDHVTLTLDTMTYSSVVTREMVCLALTMAALHDLEVKAADVLNAYVMAPNQEKKWTGLGQKFGDDAGKSAIIVRELYGLRNAGASFRAHLEQCMCVLGYHPCDADPDLWMKGQYRPEDKLEHYSYISCSVDDILCNHHDPDDVLNKLNVYMSLEPRSVRSSNMFLGTKVQHMQLHNGILVWSMNPYV